MNTYTKHTDNLIGYISADHNMHNFISAVKFNHYIKYSGTSVGDLAKSNTRVLE